MQRFAKLTLQVFKSRILIENWFANETKIVDVKLKMMVAFMIFEFIVRSYMPYLPLQNLGTFIL